MYFNQGQGYMLKQNPKIDSLFVGMYRLLICNLTKIELLMIGSGSDKWGQW